MRHQEDAFQSFRGAQIYYQAWLPEEKPSAVLVIVHGLADHSGRYGNVVAHLVPSGYAVYALDHIGHGRSGGERVYVDRFSDYSGTLNRFVDTVRQQQSGLPLGILGHSMGGLVCIDYLLSHCPSGLSGVVLSGALVRLPDQVTPITLLIAKALSALAPKTRLQALETAHISRDPEVVRAYRKDPLVYNGPIPARTGVEILQAQQRAMAEAHTITLPILMVHGGEDRLAPLAGAQAFYGALGSPDKTFQVYDGLFHEVCNEPECGLVLDDIAAWLDAHLAGPA
jgi:alpha-beta hydrolase superfamily lysophospholipase